MKTIYFFFLASLTALLLNTSCKKGQILAPNVLTNEVKLELADATDKVFLETATPGLIALVSVEGEPDFLIKRGMGNLLTAEPINENNAFRIGSVTKTFTGTAVLMMVDEGLIDLDNSIASYLPELNIPSGDAITIRMLGNMTSGLFNYSEDPDLWESYIASAYTQSFQPDSLLAIAFRYPLNFAPGTDYEYCNTNTVLLGVLLEKLTGKSAYQVITEKVISPLNLTNTYFGGSFFMHEPYSKGYSFEEEGLLDATNWNPSWGYTAGTMISNIEDLKKWARHLANGDLLSENMRAEQFNFGSDNYGFCVESIKYKNDRWIGHPGVISGYNTQLWYNPAKKITLAINSNTADNLPAQSLLIAYIRILENL